MKIMNAHLQMPTIFSLIRKSLSCVEAVVFPHPYLKQKEQKLIRKWGRNTGKAKKKNEKINGEKELDRKEGGRVFC